MIDRRPSSVLAAAIELLDRAQTILVARLADMTEAQNGWPASPALDPNPRGKVTFCEVHGRERCECGGGTPMANLSDPTGEAGIRPDRASADRRRLEQAIRAVERQAVVIDDLLAKYAPRLASEKERADTARSNERDIACWSCARTEVARGVPRWEPSRCQVEVDGHRRQLCRWCQDWVRTFGVLPTPAKLDEHHRGIRVRVG